MEFKLQKEGRYHYIDEGEGQPVVILHGLMGNIKSFSHIVKALSENGYRAIVPVLPLYSISILRATVNGFSHYIHSFTKKIEIDNFYLLGNSLGGHISLVYATHKPERVKGLILTGSSGLYENAGSSYPKRGDYNYIKEKAQEVFYDPAVADKELVDEIYSIVNNRLKALHTLSISKSAIRHNMEKELPNITAPTCLIWGREDIVTPAEVAVQFDHLMPNSELHWIDKCGHAPMLEHPDIFCPIVLEWLDKQK